MKKLVILAALVACKKDAPPPNEPSNEEGSDEVTCDTVAQNPVIADDPATRSKFLEYCKAHPEEATPALLACFQDATSKAGLEACEDGTEVEEAEPERSEAELGLDALKKSLKAYLADNAGFPERDEPLTPATPCCANGRDDRKCQTDASDWLGVWADLDFAIEEPTFFQYAYTGTADSFTAIAVGDLDCDDAMMTYTLTAELNDGAPTWKLTKPEKME